MAKKILLFIVEGPTDETALSTVFNRIFSSELIRFHVIHGDLLTKDFITPDKIIAEVNAQIKRFCGNIYKPIHFAGVVHLIDTDGAFIPENAIIKDQSKGRAYPYYTDDTILTPAPDSVIDRNKRKRSNILKLTGLQRIGGIPYQIYYFSCNLDHVLHGERNLTEDEKILKARDFDLRYADHPDAFIRLLKSAEILAPGDYRETWSYIQSGLLSLQRRSNVGLILPEIDHSVGIDALQKADS